MPLDGTLRDLSLPDLIQLQCGQQRRVQIRMTRPGREGLLVIADGELIHARVGRTLGEAAVYELLSWQNAVFHVTEEPDPLPLRNVHTPWSALLLEGLRRVDEARAKGDAALETALQGMQGRQGLRRALVVDAAGSPRAVAGDGHPKQDGALVAFVAGRALAIAESLDSKGTLDLGPFEHLLVNLPGERIWIGKLGAAFVAGWLDGRASPDSLQTLVDSFREETAKQAG